MSQKFAVEQPTRAEIDGLTGAALLEFGTDWCGHCRAAQPVVAQALTGYPDMRHIMVEDGSGRALGRSFGVTLWPTLVLLQNGREVARLVRPVARAPVDDLLARLDIKAT